MEIIPIEGLSPPACGPATPARRDLHQPPKPVIPIRMNPLIHLPTLIYQRIYFPTYAIIHILHPLPARTSVIPPKRLCVDVEASDVPQGIVVIGVSLLGLAVSILVSLLIADAPSEVALDPPRGKLRQGPLIHHPHPLSWLREPVLRMARVRELLSGRRSGGLVASNPTFYQAPLVVISQVAVQAAIRLAGILGGRRTKGIIIESPDHPSVRGALPYLEVGRVIAVVGYFGVGRIEGLRPALKSAVLPKILPSRLYLRNLVSLLGDGRPLGAPWLPDCLFHRRGRAHSSRPRKEGGS